MDPLGLVFHILIGRGRFSADLWLFMHASDNWVCHMRAVDKFDLDPLCPVDVSVPFDKAEVRRGKLALGFHFEQVLLISLDCLLLCCKQCDSTTPPVCAFYHFQTFHSDHISQAFQGGHKREGTVLAGVKRKSMGFVEDNQAMLILIWFMVDNVFEKMRR